MADDDEIGPECFDFERKSFTYYVFDGSTGCDICQDHATAEPCHPPERPHPNCDCDIVEKEFVLPPLFDLRCELLGTEAHVEAGEAQTRDVHMLSELPPEFEEYTRTGDPGPIEDRWGDDPEHSLGGNAYRFDISFTAKIDHYEPPEDGDDDDDDGGGDDDDGGGGSDLSAICDEPEVETDESGTRDGGEVPGDFYLEDLDERSYFRIHYAVWYVCTEIRFRIYLVFELGGETREVPLFEHTVKKYKSTGVFISEVEIVQH